LRRTREALAKAAAQKEREEKAKAAKAAGAAGAGGGAGGGAGRPAGAMAMPGMGGGDKGDHLNALQLAMQQRQARATVCAPAAEEDGRGRLGKQVTATLTGKDSSAILKEINARRAMRTMNQTINTKRMFASGTLPKPE
jgi:hypothetical protein